MSTAPTNSASMSFDSSDARASALTGVAVGAFEARPYSQPLSESPRVVDAVLIDAIRAAVGPYVPQPWRTTTVATAKPQSIGSTRLEAPVTADAGPGERAVALPWIDSFLDTSNAEPVAMAPVVFAVQPPVTAIFASPQVSETDGDATADENALMTDAPAADSPTAPPTNVSDDVVELQLGDGDAMDEANDEWPLADAGAMMESLAADIAAENTANVSDARTVARITPMPAWSDNDVMDIMPIRAADAPTASNEQWATQARREAEGAGGAEAVAAVLEGLARRVRGGELSLSDYRSDMGDAAALASTLAALLGVRK